MPQFVFDHNGSTTSASGRFVRFRAGVPIEAEDGAFDHMEPGSYQTRPLAAGAGVAVTTGAQAPGKSAPARRIGKGKGGWFTLTEDGREVGKVQGEEKARQWQTTGTLPD